MGKPPALSSNDATLSVPTVCPVACCSLGHKDVRLCHAANLSTHTSPRSCTYMYVMHCSATSAYNMHSLLHVHMKSIWICEEMLVEKNFFVFVFLLRSFWQFLQKFLQSGCQLIPLGFWTWVRLRPKKPRVMEPFRSCVESPSFWHDTLYRLIQNESQSGFWLIPNIHIMYICMPINTYCAYLYLYVD